MKKILSCPGCNTRMRIEIRSEQDSSVTCPKCQKRLLIRATQKVPKQESFDENDEWESNSHFESDDGDTQLETYDESEEADLENQRAFEDQWDEFGNAIDHTKKKKKKSANDEKSSGISFIRTPLMDRDDYSGAGDTIRSPFMKGLYSISNTLFANVYVGFATIVAATLLVIVLPLWSLNKQWRQDAGVESGDEILMIQTLGNVKTVINAGEKAVNGEYDRDGLKKDIESIKGLNRDAAKAHELLPDGKLP